MDRPVSEANVRRIQRARDRVLAAHRDRVNGLPGQSSGAA